MKPLIQLTLGLATASSVCAQIGSLSEAPNASFDLFGIPASPTADAPRIRFTGDPAVAPSIAFSFWWYYRVGGDASESAFNNSGGQLTSSFVNKRAALRWADVDSRGLEATYVITVHSSSATSAMNVHHMTVTNRTGGPITLDLFAYADIDHCGTASGDDASGAPERHSIADAACPGVFAEFFGVDPTNYVVGGYPTVLDTLVDGAVTDLPNTGLPLTNADITGAMQWTSPVLADGESFRAVAAISHGHTFQDCGLRASSRNFGLGTPGIGGAPEIRTNLAPVIYSSGELRLRNAPPGANGSLLYGPTPVFGDIGASGFGLNVYVSSGSTPITFDANGSLNLLLPLPLQSVNICGFPFYFQAFVIDPTSTAQFGITASDAIEWMIGH